MAEYSQVLAGIEEFVTEKMLVGDRGLYGQDVDFFEMGLDSLDHVELIMHIEDEYGIDIPDDRASELTTPRSLALYVLENPKD